MLSVQKIQELILEAGREPIERDTTYHRVHRNTENFREWKSGEPVVAFDYRQVPVG